MSGNGKFLRGGIIGVIIGGIAGVLFAPKSGKETRDDIKKGAVKAKRQTEKQLKRLYSELDERIATAMKSVEKLSGTAKKELEEVIEASRPLKDKIKELISSLRDGDEVDETEVENTIEKANRTASKLKKKSR